MSFAYPFILWFLAPAVLYGYLRLKSIVKTAVVALALIALSHPYLSKNRVQSHTPHRQIVIALDASYSMFARDIPPHRYGYAKETIKHLLSKLENDYVTLMVFTTNALMLSPPTNDYRVVLNALEGFRPEHVLTKGTSLLRLFESLERYRLQNQTLILLSDGGDERQLQAWIKSLKRTKTHLVVLGLATPQGSTLSVSDGKTLVDKEGKLVVSRLNPLLKSLTQKTEGVYIAASPSPSSSAQTLYDALPSAKKLSAPKDKKERFYLHWIFALSGALLLLSRYSRLPGRIKWLTFLAPLSAQAFMLESVSLQAGYLCYKHQNYRCALYAFSYADSSLEGRYAHANTLYRIGRFEEALRLYGKIKTDDIKLKAKLLHNMGNCAMRQNNYDTAQNYYEKALRLHYDDDTFTNYILASGLNTSKLRLGKTGSSSQGGKSATSPNKSDKKPQRALSASALNGGTGHGNDTKKTPSVSKHTSKGSPMPLSSKIYDFINKGYTHEQTPW